MNSMIILALKDLKKRWVLSLILAILFGITFAAYFTLITYERNSSSNYSQLDDNWLVVGKSDGLSEFYGSRLTPEIKELLVQKGYAEPIPEIHQIVGTSYSNEILMRGFRLTDYQKVSSFSMLSGRALQPGDASRLVMIGEMLARINQVQVGDDLLIRGRKFKIIGIFKTGSFQDNEAWVSLEDAQKLLNYGEDVSLFLIPDSGALKAGTLLTDGVSVTQKGEAVRVNTHSIKNFFVLLRAIANIAGIATIITMSNLLWRLAYLRRHEFGILKSLGFGFKSLLLYFSTQVWIIILMGLLIGFSFSYFLLFAKMQSFSTLGFGLVPTLDVATIGSILLLTLVVVAIAVFMPLLSIHKTSIPELLGRD